MSSVRATIKSLSGPFHKTIKLAPDNQRLSVLRRWGNTSLNKAIPFRLGARAKGLQLLAETILKAKLALSTISLWKSFTMLSTSLATFRESF